MAKEKYRKEISNTAQPFSGLRVACDNKNCASVGTNHLRNEVKQ